MYLYIPILNKKINFHDSAELYAFIKKAKSKGYKCGLLSLRSSHSLDMDLPDESSIYYSILDFDASMKEEIDKGKSVANIRLNWYLLPYTLFKNWYYKSVINIYRKKFSNYLDERDRTNQARRKKSINNIFSHNQL